MLSTKIKRRDKEAKIQRIIQVTRQLLEKSDLGQLTIRDIAKEANVSIGLIYKYFPEGKPAIIKEIGLITIHDFNNILESIDKKADFPDFLNSFIRSVLEHTVKNKRLLRATAVTALTDIEVLKGHEMINEQELKPLTDRIFCFKGIQVTEDNSLLFTAKWIDLVLSAINHYTLYPTPFESDKEIITMLTDISLEIWKRKKQFTRLMQDGS
ncbi:MAG: TetR/AcrR family transcriptional regulator [Candidatus Bathyarchaeia archaeon]|jgi:AcrR family transcriptional regulator